MDKSSITLKKENHIFIAVSSGLALLLCPLIVLFRMGYMNEYAKYAGLLCAALNIILFLRYKTYKRLDVDLIFILILWGSLANLHTGQDIMDSFGNEVLRNWHVVLLFYQIPIVSPQEKKEAFVSGFLIAEVFSLTAVMLISMYSEIRLLLDDSFEGIKHTGKFVAGRFAAFGNPNSAGAVSMALTLLSLAALFRVKKFRWKKAATVFMTIGLLAGVTDLSLARSRGAMVATAFGIGTLFFVLMTQKYGRKMLGTFFACIPVVAIVLLLLFVPRIVFEKIMPEENRDDIETYEITYALDTMTDRTLVWPACIRMVAERPEQLLWGMTTAGGNGRIVRDIYEGRPELVLGTAHNVIMQQLLFFGMFGMSVALVICILWIVNGLKVLFSKEQNDGKPFFAIGFGIMTFGIVEAIIFPYSYLCPSCLALFFAEGYGMSELKEKKKRPWVWVIVLLVLLTCLGLAVGTYLRADKEIEEKYSSIQTKEQAPGEYVRLNNNVSLEMMDPLYWTGKKADAADVLKSYGEIVKVNDDNKRMIVSGDVEFSLKETGTEFYYKTAISLIKDTAFSPVKPENYLLDGKPTDTEYWKSLEANLNLEALTERITTRFGFGITRTTLKRYPTDDKVYESGDSLFFDQMVQSDIQPFMPVAILHESLDGEWFYVIAYGYGGWIKKTDIALCNSRDEWLEKQNPDDFIVVTGRELSLFDNPYCEELSGISVPMGTVIPIANIREVPESIQERAGYGNYIGKLFYRGEDGYLLDEYVLIPISEDVSLGYLPYRQDEVVKLLFKYLGVVYGWAGDNDSVDCSLYVRQVYRCFGFEMPRAAKPQAELYCKENYDVAKTSLEKKKEILKAAPIGTLLYFPGHIMMYLGMENGDPYCISSVGDYSTVELGKGNIETANTVIITNMSDTTRGTGESWLDSVERIVIP